MFQKSFFFSKQTKQKSRLNSADWVQLDTKKPASKTRENKEFSKIADSSKWYETWN